MSLVTSQRTSSPSKFQRFIDSFVFRPYAEFPHKLVVLDLIERGFMCVVYCQFVARMLLNLQFHIEAVLIILAETLPVILILGRKPSHTMSENRADWIFGLLGTVGPLFVVAAHTNDLVPVASIGYAVTTLGMAIQVGAKICLGRSFGLVAANRGVRVLGPYRFVRHPMYAGYIISYAGILMMLPSLINAIIYASVTAIHVIRIGREERVLVQDPAYQEFKERVRYRLIPGIF